MKLNILYGTETGNSKGLAVKVMAKAEKNTLQASLTDLASCTPETLGKLVDPSLFIVSTWDDGAPPPKCRAFFTSLMQYTEPMPNLRFSILALGDREYPLFCECGKQLEARLLQLGGTLLMPRAELGADFMSSYIGWSKQFWKTMAAVYGVAA